MFPGLIRPAGRKVWLRKGMWVQLELGWAALPAPSLQNILGVFWCSCHPTRGSQLWPKVLRGAQGCRKEAECGLL